MEIRVFAPNDISCFRKVIRTNNQLEQWHGQIYGEGGRKKHNLYMIAELIGKDAVKGRKRATGIHRQGNTTKKSQIEKDKKIEAAYKSYIQHKNAGITLTQLVNATSDVLRWRLIPIDANYDLDEIDSV